jgi:hypothetical protein
MPAGALQAPPPITYPEFWRAYLAAHADPRTGVLYYLGTLFGVAALVAAAATWDWRWILVAPVIGYPRAWFGHLVFEQNRPVTFGHPGWSLISDFRMLGLLVSGRLDRELRREEWRWRG